MGNGKREKRRADRLRAESFKRARWVNGNTELVLLTTRLTSHQPRDDASTFFFHSDFHVLPHPRTQHTVASGRTLKIGLTGMDFGL